jgi:hypothetical protein
VKPIARRGGRPPTIIIAVAAEAFASIAPIQQTQETIN